MVSRREQCAMEWFSCFKTPILFQFYIYQRRFMPIEIWTLHPFKNCRNPECIISISSNCTEFDFYSLKMLLSSDHLHFPIKQAGSYIDLSNLTDRQQSVAANMIIWIHNLEASSFTDIWWNDVLPLRESPRASIHYADGRLTARYREVSKPRDSG